MAYKPKVYIEDVEFVIECQISDEISLEEIIFCDDNTCDEYRIHHDGLNEVDHEDGYYLGIVAALLSDFIRHKRYFTLEELERAVDLKIKEDEIRDPF